MSSGDELSVASLLDATIANDGDENEVESIDDESDYSTSTYTSDAEREWEESLKQLELLLGMVVVPFVGKYFGRKCAYWGENVIIFAGMLIRCRMGSIYGMAVPSYGHSDFKKELQSSRGFGSSHCAVVDGLEKYDAYKAFGRHFNYLTYPKERKLLKPPENTSHMLHKPCILPNLAMKP
jgi:hypothetical protein